MTPDPPPAAAHAVMLFDGVCALCSGSVNFVIDRDPARYFRFASQQSPAGRALLEAYGVPGAALRTVVLLERGRCYTRSDAILRIFRRLRGPARLLALGVAIPAFLRDAAYDWVASNRYRWFGRLDACRMPTPDRAATLLDAPAVPLYSPGTPGVTHLGNGHADCRGTVPPGVPGAI